MPKEHPLFALQIMICYLLLSFLSCKANVPDSSQNQNGKIIEMVGFPSVHIDPRTIFVWLPADYDSTKQYAVLYMHDGQMLFDSSTNWANQEWKADETMTRMLDEKLIRDAIVVGIPNNGIYRWAEYVPQAILESIPAASKEPLVRKWLQGKPLADQYLKFIVTELKPYIDQHYATLPEADHTFIMGSSMGGIISLYAICEYPEVFGGAGCMSTHWPLDIPGVEDEDISYDVPGEYFNYLESHLPSPATHRIYFDYGSATLDRLYKPYQEIVDSLMVQKGYTRENWITREFPGEDHSERAWAKRLHIPLTFLLGPS